MLLLEVSVRKICMHVVKMVELEVRWRARHAKEENELKNGMCGWVFV